MILTSKIAALRRFLTLPRQLDNQTAENRLRCKESDEALRRELEANRLLTGKLFAAFNRSLPLNSLHDAEFSVFSQFGDDGIIQWLIANIDIENDTFVEFGVEDYTESNTRFLLMNNNWRGMVMDGDRANIERIRNQPWFWKHDLTAVQAFVTAENVNNLISDAGIGGPIGLLHIDIDGMDYWIWKAIDVISPSIAVVEFNSLLGTDRAVSVPYDGDFVRWRAHHSGLYSGASLPALQFLGLQKKYTFIGTNSAGNNAYFVRQDCCNARLLSIARQTKQLHSRVRECRDHDGRMMFKVGSDAVSLIKGLPLVDVTTNCDTSL